LTNIFRSPEVSIDQVGIEAQTIPITDRIAIDVQPVMFFRECAVVEGTIEPRNTNVLPLPRLIASPDGLFCSGQAHRPVWSGRIILLFSLSISEKFDRFERVRK
jgi:hypothetical protein